MISSLHNGENRSIFVVIYLENAFEDLKDYLDSQVSSASSRKFIMLVPLSLANLIIQAILNHSNTRSLERDINSVLEPLEPLT